MAKKNILLRARIQKAERLLQQNRADEAYDICIAICKRNKLDAQAWALLGKIERYRGLYQKAGEAAQLAIKASPGHAEAWKILGTVQQLQGHIAPAIASYLKSTKLVPDDAETFFLLGNAQREVGELAKADRAYMLATELYPDYVEALCNRGALLTILGRSDEARDCLEKADRLKAGQPQILCNLATLYTTEGRDDEAEAIVRGILEKDPYFVDAIEVLVEKLEKEHKLVEVQELIDRGLKIAPGKLSLNIAAAKVERQNGKVNEAINRLEAVRRGLPETLQQDILLLLGQLYDKKKDTDKAFEFLSRGNRLKERSILQDTADCQHYLKRLLELDAKFDSGEAANWRPFEEDTFSDNPVFLYGFPRSGTTLLETILDSHPKLESLSEKPTIQAVEHALRGKSISSLDFEDIQRLRKIYFTEVNKYLPRDPNLTLVDKMPLNTVQAHLIWRLFPNAKCILAIRHPCDAVFSCFMQSFTLNHAMATFFTVEKTAEAYAGVMALWHRYIEVLPIQYHRIRYEDLVADQVSEARRLINFLGLEWDERLLRHDEHAQTKKINTPSYHQVTKPIYQDAKYRWKRYEKYMQPVLPILQPYIDYFDYGVNRDAETSAQHTS